MALRLLTRVTNLNEVEARAALLGPFGFLLTAKLNLPELAEQSRKPGVEFPPPLQFGLFVNRKTHSSDELGGCSITMVIEHGSPPEDRFLPVFPSHRNLGKFAREIHVLRVTRQTLPYDPVRRMELAVVAERQAHFHEIA